MLSWEEIRNKSNQFPEVQVVLEAIRNGKWDKCPIGIKAIHMEISECQGVVLRGRQILIPLCLRSKVLELAHEGHLGKV